MADKLNIASIALDIAWGNPLQNLDSTEELIEKLPDDIDLVVVPELFTTGFINDETVMAELSEQKYVEMALQRAEKWSGKLNAAVCGSITAEDNGNIYNRAFFITPNGETTFYDKRHLFSLSSENRTYTPGKTPRPIIRFRDWNISMMVCYDLRFPVWSRNRHHEYDLMLVPANWPTARGFAWRSLMTARAIENQAIYVGCDRGGCDNYGQYDGLSMILDAYGRPIHTVIEGTEEAPRILLASPSLTDIHKTRRKLPVIDSADEFNIIIE